MNQEPVATLDQWLRRLLRRAELLLADGAEPPAEIPPELRQIEGYFDDKPIRLLTWRLRSPYFASLTLAALEAEGRLCSLTVIGLPQPGAPWPVLGMDIIALRGSISLLAIDLAPTDWSFWKAHCEGVLHQVRAAAAPALVLRKRPDFTAEAFSPLALIAGVRSGQEAPALAAAELLLERIAEILRSAALPQFSPVARERQSRWLAAERRNRKEHNALERMFGPALATHYLDDFLFRTDPGGA